MKRFACLLIAVGFISHAKSAFAGTRVDVPISQIALPNGDTRYHVSVTVGDGKAIDAALDTGSVGLRVLKSALMPSQYRATNIRRSRPFASGAQFSGVLAQAKVAVGGIKTIEPVMFQLIETADCIKSKPSCPISRVKPEDARIAGDGYPGQGFQALLGVSMRATPAAAAAVNPLKSMGDASWIIELPLPGDKAPGHLIINPSNEERAQFTIIRLVRQGDDGWADGALAGCIIEEATARRFCGKTLLDTGAPGFSIDAASASGPTQWKQGTPAKLELSGSKPPVVVDFETSLEWSNRVLLHKPADPAEPRISAGTLPFFFYDVLYDAKVGAMGFRRHERH